MVSKFRDVFVDSSIKLSVITILIIAASTHPQYGYYIFVRWSVTFTFIYFIYKSSIKKQIGLIIFYSAGALLFNPFKQFWFQKETWHLIDYLVASITLLTIISDWSYLKKNKFPIKN
jgi:hypothetical protein